MKRGFRLSKRGADIPPARKEAPADLAADYLRRFMPVHRCGPTGRFLMNGGHFRVGNLVMTPAETIAKANKMREKENA